ncbi:MAG: site-specific integrase, partial [Acidimicrobiia bacterium]|nr:site-specific integrase [Acidimicrobiia bacterium]
ADDEHATLWLLLATSGCRRGEALGLTWEDVNFDARRITIRRSLSYAGRVAVLEEPKTARSRRSVAIPAKTVTALKAHRSRQAETRLAVGPDYDPRGFVFAKPDGTPLTPATATRRFKRLASTLNLPELSIHGLRHSYATIALESGVPAKVTQEQLGHSSIATTLDLYSHAVPGLQEDAAETVAALLFGES